MALLFTIYTERFYVSLSVAGISQNGVSVVTLLGVFPEFYVESCQYRNAKVVCGFSLALVIKQKNFSVAQVTAFSVKIRGFLPIVSIFLRTSVKKRLIILSTIGYIFRKKYEAFVNDSCFLTSSRKKIGKFCFSRGARWL